MALKLGIIGIRGRSVIFIRVGAVQHISAAGKNGEAKKGKIGVWGEGGGHPLCSPRICHNVGCYCKKTT